jgi:hypothetical protein
MTDSVSNAFGETPDLGWIILHWPDLIRHVRVRFELPDSPLSIFVQSDPPLAE